MLERVVAEPVRRARRHAGAVRGLTAVLGLAVALAVAGCTTSAATPSAGSGSSVAGVTATATAPAAPTPTPVTTAAATASPTTATSPTAGPTASPTQLPALAIGLCTGAQLSLTITAWIGDPGAGTTYPHLTAKNVSSASCNMRGSSRVQILSSGGTILADAGSSAAKVSSGDPVFVLAPNGEINTIAQWSNWCKAAPSQNLKVAMVLPFGLGRIVAPAIGVAPVPTCYASGSATVASSEAWLP